jgi:protein SCO1/2
VRSAKSTWLFIFFVFAIPVLAYALVGWYQDKYEKLPVLNAAGNTENLLTQLSAFNFVNQEGRKLNNKDWDNKILLVDFFFTRCPSICPKMTASLKEVDRLFANENFLQLVSFTVDPERDSSNQLLKYSRLFGLNTKRWNLITGSKKDIYKLARNGFKIVATDGDGGPDDFIHSDKIVLIDAQKNIRGYYSGIDAGEVKQLIADITKIRNEN